MVRWGSLAFALILAVPAAVPAQGEFETKHITVYGTSTVQVVPDQLMWLLTVRNLNRNSTGAAEANAASVSSVTSFLKQNQIEEKTIQTSNMQLGENWIFRTGERIQDGYFASTNVQFTLADLKKYPSIWIGLSGIQGVQVANVNLEHSNRIRFQDEARTKAVVAARNKAKAIAEALDAQLGEPLAIEEDLSVADGYRTVAAMNSITSNEISMAGSPAVGEQAVAPGTIPVRARVKASFKLIVK